jgi:hypothetical protein
MMSKGLLLNLKRLLLQGVDATNKAMKLAVWSRGGVDYG